MSNPVGRPPKYPTPELLQAAVDSYFDGLKDGQPPTVSGLALHLGMSRQAFCDYAHKDDFLDTIKAARQRIEAALESGLWGSSVTGLIFNLKNNFGWKDKRDHELSNPDGTMRPTTIQLVAAPDDNGTDTPTT